jgi:LysM repeat protein
MRLRALLFATISLAALLVACGDDDTPSAPDASSTPVPSATPYAATPTPIIVRGDSGGSAGASGQEITYTVESGDTLLVLATRYDTTVEAIMKRNNIASAADLQVGQQLVIPSGKSSVATPAATTTPPPAGATTTPGGGQSYTVKSGDLASNIATRFNVSLDQLAAANHRSVESLDQLEVGETLTIP